MTITSLPLFCLVLGFITSIQSFSISPQLQPRSPLHTSHYSPAQKLFLKQRDDEFDDDDFDDDPTTDIVPSTGDFLPRDSRLIMSSKMRVETTDAGSLLISIPKVGLQSSNMFDLGFTASWLGIIGYMTMGMVRAGTGPVGALFTIPFWMAGASMANKSVIDPATDVRITIGVYGWSLEKTLAGTKTTTIEGSTWQLEEALVDSDMTINDKPLTCVQLQSGHKTYSFGHALTTREKEWVATEINEWLGKNSDAINKAAQAIQ